VKHRASPSFWSSYNKLPDNIRLLADKNFKILKSNPQHPSLHLKKADRFWSVRVGIHYRAVGVDSPEGGILWFWTGSHSEYNHIFK
jgi:hypothetical protein